MQSNITSKIKLSFKYVCLIIILGFSFGKMMAQGSVGTTYTPVSGISGGNVGITFVIENTNATPRVLTQIDMFWNVAFSEGPNTATLWYSATSLSGLSNVTTPTWTKVASNSTINIAATGTIPTFTGLNFVIPANTQYRFAIETSSGVAYGGSTTTPNNFTADGVVLKTGNFLIAGSNVGYALNPFPVLRNNPRFFAGKIYWALQIPCSGAPSPGTTISTSNSICPGKNFTLSTSTPVVPGTTGITYQWQSATTAAGPWTDIAGATQASLTTTQSAATFYRNAVTCSAGSTTNSTPLQITMGIRCYCAAGATDMTPTFEKIANVSFGTINRASAVSTGYSDYTSTSTSLEKTSVTPITITGNAGTYSNDMVSVWIDYNQDGDFDDAGENVYNSATGAGPYLSNITIPATALTGTTTMRIRLFDAVLGNGVNGPCGLADYGEVEDYSINITPCIPVTITSQLSNATITCGNNATFTFAATGTAITYQWQQRNNATSAWNIIADGGVYSGATTNTLTITGAPVSMNGFQYRVVYSSGCSATDFSTTATLTVNTLVATVSPASASICAGTLQQLTISNTAPPSTIQFCSGVINIPIPDRTGPPASTPAQSNAGINHTIPVTIPAGAVIASMNVKLNVTHTWIGDLVVVLKAPNGKILNLLYHKSGTGATSGGNNFTNTVISSAGTAAISSGTPPFTGTFKADASIGAGVYGDPQGSGPTSFQPDVTTFSSLYSIPSGNWTIAIADPDGWNGDVGTLNDWCIEFNYGAPSTGIFTGTAGTMFTDAAGTIPYTGTSINTVYVNPAVTTSYSVVVTTPTCVSSATKIPVTVSNPITDTKISVANAVSCDGKNVSFTSTATTGVGVKHQWFESVNNGTSFTAITDGGVYSGATTGTLTITGATLALNNNKYRDSLYVTACNNFKISDAATLTVNPNPVITLTAAPVTKLYPGITTTITAAVSPNAAATYSWFRNGIAVANATGNKIVVDVDHVGSYTVSVNDVNGCNTTSAGIVITEEPNASLFIYPSPSTGKFQVRYFGLDLLANVPGAISVYDSRGAKVFSKSYNFIRIGYNSMVVDLTGFAKGIYRIDLMDGNGSRIKTGSVLIL